MRSRSDVRQLLLYSSEPVNTKKPAIGAVVALLATLALIVASIGLSSCAGVVSKGASGSGSSGGSGSGGGSGTGTLSANPTSVSFGSIADGTKTSQSVTLTNTGTAIADITSAVISGTGLSIAGTAPSEIAGGSSATIQIQFAPLAPGAVTGSLSVSSDASNPQMAVGVTGTGSGPLFAISPASVSFTDVIAGQTSSKPVTISNGGNAPLTLSAASVSGTGFTTNGLSATASIAAGQSMTFNVVFTPPAAATDAGMISFADNVPGSPQALVLSGTAVASAATLTTNPAVITFGNTSVGATSKQAVTLTNSGNESITVDSLTHTGSEFTVTGLSTPMTLAAGQSTSFTVAFTPTKTGSTSGSVDVSGQVGSTDPSATVAMSGTGTDGQLGASPATVSFGNINVGSTGSSTVTLTNSGTASTTISGASVTGTGFTYTGLSTPLTLSAGQSTSFTAQFKPTSTASSSGSITVTSDASDPSVAVSLTGTGAQGALSATPASVAFGSVATGGTSSQTITLKNTGSSSVTVSAMSATGTGFSASSMSPSSTIAAGGSATFTATFKPTAAGTDTGSISVSSNAPSSPITIPLSGTATTASQLLGVSPSSISFGTVDVSSTSSASITLTNNGSASVVISSVGVTGSEYRATGVDANTTLTPNQSATLNVTFTPTAAGSQAGSISVVSNATNSPAAVTLSGTGATSGGTGGGGAPSTGAPLCGLPDDGKGHMPSDWATFTPPSAVGGTYTDALGSATGSGAGCVVKRLTVGGDTAHYYSTHEPMNSNDTYVFVAGGGTCGSGGGWCVIDLNGNVIVNDAHMPSATNPTTLFMWSATTPALFYYTNNNSLMSATITGTNTISISTVFTFSQYSYITIPDETRISLDGTTIGLVGEHTGSGTANADIFSFNLDSLSQSAIFTTSMSGSCTVHSGSEYSGSGAAPFPMGSTDIVGGCIHKIIMSTDNRVEVEWHSNTEPNMDAACKSAFAAGASCKSIITAGGTLFNLQSGTTHTDSYESLTGGENMFMSLWDPSPNGTQANDPCPQHGGHSNMNDANNAVSCTFTTVFTGGHISTAGTGPSQPWFLIAYDDTSRPKSPEWWTTSSNYVAPTNTSCSQFTSAGSAFPGNCWFPYESEMVLVRADSAGNESALGGTSGKVYRLAWSRTRDDSSSFWGQQRAAISRDGRYVIFSSNMAYPSGNCSNPSDLACDDVYLVGPLF